MGIEIVAKDCVIAGVAEGSVLIQPALAGFDLAVLFGVAVLRDDELGPQRDRVGLVGPRQQPG